MKIIAIAYNHIKLELDGKATIDINDGTTPRGGGQLNISLDTDGVLELLRHEHQSIALRIGGYDRR